MSSHSYLSRLNPGQKLGKYVILRLINRERHTEVYRATHPDFKDDLAIKLFHSSVPATPQATARFQQEAQAIVALTHPNIVRVYGYGAEKNAYYIVMELVEGNSLRDLISSHPTGLDRDDIMRIFSQLASAIAYAHDQGLVHGNIKPDNVLLDTTQRPVVTDFSIRCLPSDSQKRTPAYLSPELIENQTATPLSEQYALGILLYEMSTGDVPFKGDSYDSVTFQHLHTAVTPPGQLRGDLDTRLEDVILMALNKKPSERYASARDMLHNIEYKDEVNPYATLAFDRSIRDELRKRQSEIRRFKESRMDEPLSEVEPPFELSYWRLSLLIAVIVIVLAAIIGLIVLIF